MNGDKEHLIYFARPRYTPGDAGRVSAADADDLVQAERAGYMAAISGQRGPAAQAVAAEKGLGGILESRVPSPTAPGYWHVMDLMTDEASKLPMTPAELVEVG